MKCKLCFKFYSQKNHFLTVQMHWAVYIELWANCFIIFSLGKGETVHTLHLPSSTTNLPSYCWYVLCFGLRIRMWGFLTRHRNHEKWDLTTKSGFTVQKYNLRLFYPLIMWLWLTNNGLVSGGCFSYHCSVHLHYYYCNSQVEMQTTNWLRCPPHCHI